MASKASNSQSRRRRVPASPWPFAAILALALVLAAGAAQALGLGQIQVKSQPGQPLLAEIPIIAGDPSELEQLRVRLASPETFRRVGLQPPDVAATGLQFTVALDDRGAPVVRVTSTTPLRQPLLTFLLEVDWGGGRLVREYTALLARPETVAAAPAQPMQAPVVAEPNTVERPADAAPAVEALPDAPEVVEEGLPPADAPETTVATEQEPGYARAPAPVAAVPVPRDEPAAAVPPGGPYEVRDGDTLSEIATGLDHAGHSLDQTMLALLQANPEAFVGGNINRLRAGAVLRMPQSDELSRYSAGDAAARVRAQVAQWRESIAAREAPPDGRVADGAAPATAAEVPGEAASAEARLQIAPPASESGEAGTRTGLQAGGEGRMLRQQVQETQETLAARDAEVGELRARVAELEKLQQQQQQMIALKDSALAAAQQKLAETSAAAAPPAPQPKSDDGPVWPWLLLPLLLLAAAGAWWLLRKPRTMVKPRVFAPTVPAPAPAPAAVEPEPAPAPHWTSAPALVGAAPAFSAEAAAALAAGREQATTPARQVELARAYLDLGDEGAARELLREAIDGRDPVARDIASRMLREL